jgi:homoserine O-acetyltransferase
MASYRIERNKVFELGSTRLESGQTISSASLSYTTYGALNNERNNAILFACGHGCSVGPLEWFIRPDGPIDPERYFVISPSPILSPEASPAAVSRAPSEPRTLLGATIGDDVNAQRRLMIFLGIRSFELVAGWSLGAQHAYEWAVRFPNLVRRAAPIAGTARTRRRGRLLSNIVSSTIQEASVALASAEAVSAGYSAGGDSPGETDPADPNPRYAGSTSGLPGCDSIDISALARRWLNADVARPYGGDLAAALGRVQALTYVIAIAGDAYVPLEEPAEESLLLPEGELHVLRSSWGHFAPFGLTETDREFFRVTLRDLLSRTPPSPST